MDAHRRKLTGPDFEILDDANTPSPEASVSEDEGPVGDPDMGWVRRTPESNRRVYGRGTLTTD